MKKNSYYITDQYIYMMIESADPRERNYHTSIRIGMMMIRANVFINPRYQAKDSDLYYNHLCGNQILDNVLVEIPSNSPCIIF
jgi:hypothetical protein